MANHRHITVTVIEYKYTLTQVNFRDIVLPHFKMSYYREDDNSPCDLYLYAKYSDEKLIVNLFSSVNDYWFKEIGAVTLAAPIKPTNNDLIHAITSVIAKRMIQDKDRTMILNVLKKYTINDMFDNRYLNRLKDHFIEHILTKGVLDYRELINTPYSKDLVQYYFAIDKHKYFEIKFGLTLK